MIRHIPGGGKKKSSECNAANNKYQKSGINPEIPKQVRDYGLEGIFG